jgi:hypothetical protein
LGPEKVTCGSEALVFSPELGVEDDVCELGDFSEAGAIGLFEFDRDLKVSVARFGAEDL